MKITRLMSMAGYCEQAAVKYRNVESPRVVMREALNVDVNARGYTGLWGL